MPRNWTEAELAEIIKRTKVRTVKLIGNGYDTDSASKKRQRKYNNEAKLRDVIKGAGLPEPVLEFKFLHDRKFRFDLAWPDLMLACEIDGMAHRVKARFLADMEKMNLAREHHWLVIHCTPKMIRTGEALALVKRALQLSPQ